MAEGRGFGKVILFGEHFVVYGLPAIASAIGSKTIARVEKEDKFELDDERTETPGYKREKFDQQKKSLEFIFKAMGINPEKTPFKIILEGDLIAASGLGASAASCAAIASALSQEFNLDFSDDKINEIAYEGEKGYHGTPSGIDNTAAVFGGIIWFKKGDPNLIEKIKIEEPVEIVMGNTGLIADTAEVVEDVRKEKEKDPETFDKIFRGYEEVAKEAREAFEKYDIEKIGKLMNENHSLLQQIGVSCKELDTLVKIARDNGALGAKLTGTGRGGNMVALTPGKDLQEKVAKAIESAGFKAIKSKIGV